jgi:hypothetical protein
MHIPIPTTLRIGQGGVEVAKAKLPKELLKRFERDLMVKPKKYNPRGEEIASFPVYRDEKKKLILPPHYIREKHPKIKIDKSGIRQGKDIDVKFLGDIRYQQMEAVTAIRKGLDKFGGGILTVPCGYGKTVLAINEICYRKKKTLVVVHKSFLAKQWQKRLEKFSTAKVGVIQGKKVVVEGKDVVIAMVQSLSKSKYDESIFDEFGMVIIDECHHMAAPVFCRALSRISTKYMLGLSATPKRDDGLSKVFHWWMGPTLFYKAPAKNPKVKVHRYQYTCKHENFRQYTAWARGNLRIPDHVKTLSAMIAITDRNDFIVERMMQRLVHPGAKILVLSARRDHLTSLKHSLKKQWDDEQKSLQRAADKFRKSGHIELADTIEKNLRKLVTAYYVGGMKEKELDDAEKADVIFGTYQMAEEGLDIESLNTVILGTTKPKILQSVGRILRVMEYAHGIQPLVIDMADKIGMCTKQAALRSREYEMCNYGVQDFDEKAKPIVTIASMKGGAKHARAFKPDDIIMCDSD